MYSKLGTIKHPLTTVKNVQVFQSDDNRAFCVTLTAQTGAFKGEGNTVGTAFLNVLNAANIHFPEEYLRPLALGHTAFSDYIADRIRY